MLDDKRVLAIVPARKGSKGLALKNIRTFAGKPLLAWPVKAGLDARLVDRVVVSTDDEKFGEIAREYGADVPFLRPKELAADHSPSVDAILHAVETLAESGDSYHYVVLLEPTSPLTTGADVDAALRMLDGVPDADALLGVALQETTHPAFAVRRAPNGTITPFIGEQFGTLPRRQDLEPVYMLDGSLYISTVDALRRERSFCHGRTLGYVMPRWKAGEIDDIVDFICLEAIANNLRLIHEAHASDTHTRPV